MTLGDELGASLATVLASWGRPGLEFIFVVVVEVG